MKSLRLTELVHLLALVLHQQNHKYITLLVGSTLRCYLPDHLAPFYW
jgi:hypothetical protein